MYSYKRMADVAAEKLEQRHNHTAELSSYTNELIDMLDSGEPVVSEVQKLSDTTTKVADKISKAKNATTSTKQCKNLCYNAPSSN